MRDVLKVKDIEIKEHDVLIPNRGGKKQYIIPDRTIDVFVPIRSLMSNKRICQEILGIPKIFYSSLF